MNTYEKRKKNVLKIIQDPDSKLTPLEDAKLVYHWIRYELYVNKRNRLLYRQNKHGLHINTAIDVWRMRREMADQ